MRLIAPRSSGDRLAGACPQLAFAVVASTGDRAG
jgi:hypothetical protein